MPDLTQTLLERKEDFFSHLAFAEALDRSLLEEGKVEIGERKIDMGHLRSLKSALLIHLYNIVESVMTLTINEVGEAVQSTTPANWSDETLKEWLRRYTSDTALGNQETHLESINSAARQLLNRDPLEKPKFKKPSGTWSDTLIYNFSKRLKVDFSLTPEFHRRIAPSPYYGEKSPMEFLADRRNAIAHGRRSFEDGAKDMSIQEIQSLAEVTIEYMQLAVNAFQKFIDADNYMSSSQ